MSKTKKQNKNQSDQVSNLENNTVSVEQNNNKKTYVVVRNDMRVSDKEYTNENNEFANLEKEFWQKIVNRWPDGTKIQIVEYDKKKHRIW